MASVALDLSATVGVAIPEAIRRLKSSLQADALEFCREIGFRIPAALEAATASEIRQHFGPFLEHTFRDWAARESAEVREVLEALAVRVSGATEHADRTGAGVEPSSSTGPDSRLARPALEVSTLALDASVVASLAIGIGVLFANVAVGGLFLLAAPTLATLGREHGERALRRRAAESALKAVEEAVCDFSRELERVIDEFGRRALPSDRAPS